MDIENITQRFDELILEVREFIKSIKSAGVTTDDNITQNRAWQSSAYNLLSIIPINNNQYLKEFDLIARKYDSRHSSINTHKLLEILGLLISAKNEFDKGLLTQIDLIIAAETFDNFLDHAEEYHKAGKATESAVLASAVLEDTVKKIAKKHNIDHSKTLDPLVDDMIKINVFTPVKGKRIKAYASTHNHALHADWDKFDIKDVGEMIKGIRELIEDFL